MPDTLRIALISDHASPLPVLGGGQAGGAQASDQGIYVAHVAQCLARAGHEVDVLTRRDAPDLPATVDLHPRLRVIHIPAGPAEHVAQELLPGLMPAFAQASEQLLRHSVPHDVVHANFHTSGMVASHLRRTLGTPCVMTFHALGLVQREPLGTKMPERVGIERMLVREADALVATCPQDRNDLIRLYGAEPERVSMVTCGVDPAEFSPMDRSAARASLGLDPAEFVLLQLGRPVPSLGIDNLIRALAHLPQPMPVRLLVVGGDARAGEPDTLEIARLRRLARDQGVLSRVTFTGPRPRHELRTCHAAADVLVSTPWVDPAGLATLEAMACGTPVVGSAVGGIRHAVSDGVTGFLVPPHDPVALARRLELLHANPALARAMGRAGIHRARSRFTWERVTHELVDVYHGVRRSSPAAALPAWRPLRLVQPGQAFAQ